MRRRGGYVCCFYTLRPSPRFWPLLRLIAPSDALTSLPAVISNDNYLQTSKQKSFAQEFKIDLLMLFVFAFSCIILYRNNDSGAVLALRNNLKKQWNIYNNYIFPCYCCSFLHSGRSNREELMIERNDLDPVCQVCRINLQKCSQ